MSHARFATSTRLLLFIVVAGVMGQACRAAEQEPAEQLRRARRALDDCLVEHYSDPAYCDLERLEVRLIADAISERLALPSVSTPAPVERDWIPVEVTGTSGVMFTGQLGSGPGSQTVSGSIPTTFKLPRRAGTSHVAVFQSRSNYGTLRVSISCARSSDVRETTVAYGIISVGCYE